MCWIETAVWLQCEGVMLCEAQGWLTGRAKARVRSYLGPVPIPKLGAAALEMVTSEPKHSSICGGMC